MKKMLISYFTGTGNTLRAINIIKEYAQTNGFNVETLMVEKDVKSPENNYDTHLFAFPILALSPPKIFIDYIKKNNFYGSNIFILTINGATFIKNQIIDGYSGYAPYYIKNIIEKKGGKVLSIENIGYPENWSQVSNPPKDINCNSIYEISDNKVSKFAEIISGNISNNYKANIIDKTLWRFLIPLFALFPRRILGKIYIADKNCNGCGLCAKKCPVKTIKMSGNKPVWENDCLACNRCINICPRNAIQTSIGRLFFHGIIGIVIMIYAIICIFKLVPLIFISLGKIYFLPLQILFSIMAIIALSVFQLTIYDYLIRLLEKVPFIRPLFELSFTKYFRRYKEKNFKI